MSTSLTLASFTPYTTLSFNIIHCNLLVQGPTVVSALLTLAQPADIGLDAPPCVQLSSLNFISFFIFLPSFLFLLILRWIVFTLTLLAPIYWKCSSMIYRTLAFWQFFFNISLPIIHCLLTSCPFSLSKLPTSWMKTVTNICLLFTQPEQMITVCHIVSQALNPKGMYFHEK